MFRWFRALMPKEDRFFPLFEQHAHTVVAGAEALVRLLDGNEDIAACCRAIADEEHRADAITQDVLLAVRRTFITPFDRSDIQALIGSLDDSIDQMQKTAKTITLFEVAEFQPRMRDMGTLILRSAQVTEQAVTLLRAMSANAATLNTLTERITELEDEADDTYDDGLRALFHGSRADPMAYLVGAEIYGHLESVMDRFEDVADRISSIVVEHV